MTVHLIKIAAGVQHLDQLQTRLLSYGYDDPDHGPVTPVPTRNTPKRADELLDGGSIYWIIKGKIAARTPFIDIYGEETPEGKKVCRLCVSSTVIPTIPVPKRGFQGWRYFPAADAPDDMPVGSGGEINEISPEMAAELKELGLI